MRRASIGVVVLAVLAAGCAKGGSPLARGTSRPSGTPAASASPTPPSAQTLPVIDLRADLSQTPAAWTRVLHVTFGAATGDLAYEPSRESGPVGPSSFAVARDGSIWIADPGKSRVAHYAASGTFLGSVPAGALVHDLAFVGNHLFAILDANHGRVADLSHPQSEPVTIRRDERAVYILSLRPGTDPLAGDVGIFADGSDNDQQGLARLDVARGTYAPLAGVPVGDGRSIAVADADPAPTRQEIDLTFTGSTTQMQPVDVSLTTSANGARPVEAVIGESDVVPVGDGVAMVVAAAPSRASDRHDGDGLWLLEIGNGPLVWERVERSTVADEGQARHLTIGADGALYVMVLTAQGVDVLRRP